MRKSIAAPPQAPHPPGATEPPLSYVGVEEGQFEGCACEVCGTCPAAIRVWRWIRPGSSAAVAALAVEEGHYFCEAHRQEADALFCEPATGLSDWTRPAAGAPAQSSVPVPSPMPPIQCGNQGDRQRVDCAPDVLFAQCGHLTAPMDRHK
jgi:hypothetical protein